MDPQTFALSVVASFVANVASGFCSWLVSSNTTRVDQRKDLKRSFANNARLKSLAQRIGTDIAKSKEWDDGHLEAILVFMASRDVDFVVEKILNIQTCDDAEEQEAVLRVQFTGLLATTLKESEETVSQLGNVLFEAIVGGLDTLLTTALNDGVLDAHEWRSIIRHRQLTGELRSGLTEILARLDHLESLHNIDQDKIALAESQYSERLANHLSSNQLLNLDPPQRYPLKDLYVLPHLSQAIVFKNEEGEILSKGHIQFNSFQEFVSGIFRTVLLANAGVGKSTLCAFLNHCLASGDPNVTWNGQHPTPFWIILREYEKERSQKDLSFVDFVSRKIAARFTVNFPANGIDYLLSSGRVMVIFDGLDEIIAAADRDEICKRIEHFADQYKMAPILVTSRKIGYEIAPLNDEIFLASHLHEFDDKQVKEYAGKWFSLRAGTDLEEQEKITAEFLADCQSIRDLSHNPLLLAIICFAYSYERYIPKNRPEVYRKCSEMIYRIWDTRRGVRAASSLDKHFRPITAYLAFTVLNDQSLQAGISTRVLKNIIAEYLHGRQFDDRDEAMEVAEQFQEVFIGRCGLMVPIGTTEDDTKLYDFPHRTFMEYFSAVHLVRKYPSPRALADLLLPFIQKNWWFVVAQLAFHILADEQEEASAELMAILEESVRGDLSDASWRTVDFGAKCLSFMIPSPAAVRNFSTACLDLCATQWLPRLAQLKNVDIFMHDFGGRKETALMYDLLDAASENQKALVSAFENWIIARIESGSSDQSEMALDLASHVTLSKDEQDERRFELGGDKRDWVGLHQRVLDTCGARLKRLAIENARICDGLWRMGAVEVRDLLRWHGLEKLFHDWNGITYNNVRTVSIAHRLLRTIIEDQIEPKDFRPLADEIAQIGQAMSVAACPWVQNRERLSGLSSILLNVSQPDECPEPNNWYRIVRDPNLLFGSLGMVAVMTELSETMPPEVLDSLRERIEIFFQPIGRLLNARLSPNQFRSSEELLKGLDVLFNLEDSQRDIFEKWARREIDLVRK
jgi:hypothetical protein